MRKKTFEGRCSKRPEKKSSAEPDETLAAVEFILEL
jgi:hypothetical protein